MRRPGDCPLSHLCQEQKAAGHPLRATPQREPPQHTKNDLICYFCPCHWTFIWFLPWWGSPSHTYLAAAWATPAQCLSPQSTLLPLLPLKQEPALLSCCLFSFLPASFSPLFQPMIRGVSLALRHLHTFSQTIPLPGMTFMNRTATPVSHFRPLLQACCALTALEISQNIWVKLESSQVSQCYHLCIHEIYKIFFP